MAQVLEEEGQLGKGGPVFTPPVYKQRYEAVLSIARSLDPPPKKVVDYGCAECKLLRLLKKEEYIEELVGVDLDSVPLRVHSGLVRPLIADYLHPRPRPLHMSLLQGSIAEPDARLVNFDLLTCIEVVEHLEKPTLDAVPWAIFGCLRPRVVVMTTPNAEFNVLFPGFSGFRHHDHKFEWTRQQFTTWCDGIAEQYGYAVEYGGVGSPPPHHQHVGHCSQLATFTRTASTADLKEACAPFGSPYKLIAECDHPHQTNPLSSEEKLRSECDYYLYVLLKRQQREEEERTCEEAATTLIALKELLMFPKIKALCSDVQDIRKVLQSPSSSVKLDETGEFAVFCIPQEPEEGEEEILDYSEQCGSDSHLTTEAECWDDL